MPESPGKLGLRVNMGRTVRMVIGCTVIAVDLVVYLYAAIVQHAQFTGWQLFKDHISYLVLGYLLVDWSHAKELVLQLKDKIPGFGQKP